MARDPGRGRLGLSTLAAVAVGGSVGAVARYAVSRALPPEPDAFPWATLIANLTGSLLLGVVVALAAFRLVERPTLRGFVATGVLGAFTTYSSFAAEVVLLTERAGGASVAARYAAATLVGGLLAAWLGTLLPRTLRR